MSQGMGDMQLALALRLEGTIGAGSDELERLVDVADMVAALPDPEIDPVFAAKLEQRLLTEGLAQQAAETPEPYQGLRIVRDAEPAIAPAREEKLAPNVVTLPSRRYVLRKTLVAAIAAAMAMAMPIAMASSALPSSPGYAIKEARRALQLHFATGDAETFLMAHQARDYFSEAAQLAAIGAKADLISGTLAKANRLLTLATQRIIRTGKPVEIARLRSLIERDGDLLRSMLPTVGVQAPIFGAIDHIEGLSDALARAMGVILDEPAEIAPAVAPIVAGITASTTSNESSQKASSSGSKGTDSGESPSTGQPPVEGPGEINPANPGGCANIGSTMLGDTLETPSQLLCRGAEDQGSN